MLKLKALQKEKAALLIPMRIWIDFTQFSLFVYPLIWLSIAINQA